MKIKPNNPLIRIKSQMAEQRTHLPHPEVFFSVTQAWISLPPAKSRKVFNVITNVQIADPMSPLINPTAWNLQ